MLEFVDAKPAQANVLKDTLIASKGYWGHSKEQLEHWRTYLSFEADYINRNTVKLVMERSQLIGFFAIVKNTESELDHFWLLPAVIGKGYGNLVFDQIIVEFKRLNISEFFIVSDPNAEGFYLKKGAAKVGEVFSEAQNRMLPRLKIVL